MLAQLPNNGVGFEEPSLMNGDNADNGEHAELTMLTTEDNENLSNATQELCVERASEPVQDAVDHARNITEKRLLRPVTGGSTKTKKWPFYSLRRPVGPLIWSCI